MVRFEGSEKRLELYLKKPMPQEYYLEASETFWQSILQKTGARIISRLDHGSGTAFLLSESSLFLTRDRILLVTCGVTDPIAACGELMSHIPRDKFGAVLYERRAEFWPENQRRSFEEDIQRLSCWFPGEEIQVGNGSPFPIRLYRAGSDVLLKHRAGTLELMLYELDPALCRSLIGQEPDSANLESGVGNLLSLFKDFQFDDYRFSPPGYSANGWLDGQYCTVHVSWHAAGSYASLEMDGVAESDLGQWVHPVLNVFKPRQYVMMYAHEGDADMSSLDQNQDLFTPDRAEAVSLGHDLTLMCRWMKREDSGLP